MATTSQVTTYRSAGQPDDAVGAVGDTCFDTNNRIVWVKQSGNTWVGGAYSNIGPTGPAMLSGSGIPNNNYGQNGQGYTDLTTGSTYFKSSNSWAQVGSIQGAQGLSGANVLGSTGAAFGQAAALSGASLSTTPTTMTYPGTTVPVVFQPMVGSALLGASVQGTQSGTATFSLYNQTTSQTVYSLACPTNSNTSPYATSGTALFPVTQYPLNTGNQYVWQMSDTKSETAGGTVWPIYATPSGSTAAAVSTLPLLGWPTSQTWAANNQYTMPLFGGTTPPSYYYPVRTGGCYAMVLTLTATGSTATTATAKFLAYYQSGNGLNSASAMGMSNTTITANGIPATIFGPSSDTSTFTTGYRFFFQIQPNAAMTATAALQIYSYA